MASTGEQLMSRRPAPNRFVETRDVPIRARTGRYVDGLDEPKWGTWRMHTIRVTWVNDIPTMFVILDYDWAEYHRSQRTDDTFEAEGYYLQVEDALDLGLE